MGYYTYYTVSGYKNREDMLNDAHGLDKELEYKIANELYKLVYETDEELSKECGWSYFDEMFSDSMKWYDCEDHMLEISRKFPTVWFKVEGIGEDYDDRWVMYVYNGKFKQVFAEIYYPEVDFDALETDET